MNYPIDRELTDTVAWTSSDETVARVSDVEPRRVSTANAGTALLRASTGIGLTATVAVLVVNADADQLQVNPVGVDPVKLSLGPRASAQLELLGHFGGNWYCVTTDATWMSDHPEVATVVKAPALAGHAQSVALGNAIVTAFLKSGTCKVNDTILVQAAFINAGLLTQVYVLAVAGRPCTGPCCCARTRTPATGP